MSELTKQQEFDRGTKANALLSNELLKEAFDEIERQIFEQFKASKPQEKEERERLYQALGLPAQIYSILRAYAGSGTIAAQAIEKMKRKA